MLTDREYTELIVKNLNDIEIYDAYINRNRYYISDESALIYQKEIRKRKLNKIHLTTF